MQKEMTQEQRVEYYEKINKQFHRMGRITTTIGIVALLAFPFAICILYGTVIDWKGFGLGILNVGIIYYPVAVVEFLTFAPMVGVGGSYLSFLTGNLTNLKIPCAMNARDIAGVEAGTPENEVVSTLSIATSALVTMAVIFVGVLLMAPLAPVLENPTLQPAFDNVVAALFGALALKYFIKQPKIAVVPVALMIALCVIVPSTIGMTSYLMIPAGLLALGIGYYLNKKGLLRES